MANGKAVTVVRQASPPATARAPTARGKGGGGRLGGMNVKTTLAAVAGGAGGALIGGLLVRSGVEVKTAAIGITAAGAMGAMTLNGPARAAAYGAAAAGAGQLALGWLAKRANKTEVKQPAPAPAPVPQRQGLGCDDARRAFADARREEMEDEYDEEMVDAA